jgi:chromosome segregation ATPase
MSKTTIEDQLAEVLGRLERLRAFEQAGGAAERARTRRHLDVLRREDASVRDAVRHAPDEVEEKLAQLRTRLYVAEHSVAADLSDDWTTFAEAVEEELRRWDDYLERLQASVAAKAWKEREQAEAAIGDARSRRIEVGERLAEARDDAGDATEYARKRVIAARDKLEQRADELSAKLMGKRPQDAIGEGRRAAGGRPVATPTPACV